MAMVIVGLMKDPHEARGAVRALRDAGFVLEEIDTQGNLAECLSEFGVPEGENAAYIMAEHGAVDLAACVEHWTDAAVNELFGEVPNGPGRVYRDPRTEESSRKEESYRGPERRRRDHPYVGINRRAA